MYDLADLKAFTAIIDHGSFARAAAHLRVSPSALSQTLRGLENRLGVRLIHRTTRSLSPSEAGTALLQRVRPALAELDAAVAATQASRETPTGMLRINLPRMAGTRIVAPILRDFHAACPEVKLHLVEQDALTDIVAGGFDAGIRLGERLEQDMVAVRLRGPMRMRVVGSPSYFAVHERPTHPRDLRSLPCLNWVQPTDGALYRWEFERDGESLEVAVDGPLNANDPDLLRCAAVSGLGLTYLFEQDLEDDIAAGRLVTVLDDWTPPFPGLYLYYPSRSQMRPALRAFIDCLLASS